MLVAELERVDHAQDLGKVAASRGRVRERQADGLLGVNHKDRADSEGHAAGVSSAARWVDIPLGVDVGGVLVVEHVVEGGNLAVLVANNGEIDVGGPLGERVNVLDPAVVAVDVVGRETDELHVLCVDAAVKKSRKEGSVSKDLARISMDALPEIRGSLRRRWGRWLTFTPRDSKSAADWATAESSVVQTGV